MWGIKMRVFLRLLISLVFVVGAFTASAHAKGKRVALVIGNSAYEHTTQLANPKNDAEDVAEALSIIGFDVTKVDDANFSKMRKALRDFGRKSQGSDIAMVYFAGHGMEVDKRNYLIPVDAQLVSDQDVEYEAISIELLNRAVAGAKNLRMILLDACRNNPFVSNMERSNSTRAIGRGLAPVEPQHGTLVSYAAREGTTAADGEGRNSPYTKALVSHIQEPGLDIRFLFAKVRDSVLEATSGAQEPFMYGSLPGKEIYLVPGETPKPKPSADKKPGTDAPVVIFDPTKSNTVAVELEYWDTVKNSGDIEYIQSYLDQYPNGKFVPLARLKIKRLEKEKEKEVAVVTPPAKDDIVPAEEKDDNFSREELIDFIRYNFLSASIDNPSHLRNLYSSRVNYYQSGYVDIDFIIKDKINYFNRWPKYFYEYVENTASIERLDKNYFRVEFQSRFELENSTKKTSGVSRTTLSLLRSNNQYKITSENGKIIDQKTDDLVAKNCTPRDGPYRVVNIRSNDTLNVRAGRSTSNRILGELEFNATGIYASACDGRWCAVKYGCLSGFASQKYLSNGSRVTTTSTRTQSNTYHVVGHTPSEELNVRRGPSTKYSIIGTIPHNGSGIIVNACNSISGFRYKWCQVNYRGVTGWAYAKYLADNNGRLAN